MAADPFEVLAQAISRKSNLKLMQAKVTGIEGGAVPSVELLIRGATVHDVPYTGAVPQTNDIIWVLVDDGVILGLT